MSRVARTAVAALDALYYENLMRSTGAWHFGRCLCDVRIERPEISRNPSYSGLISCADRSETVTIAVKPSGTRSRDPNLAIGRPHRRRTCPRNISRFTERVRIT